MKLRHLVFILIILLGSLFLILQAEGNSFDGSFSTIILSPPTIPVLPGGCTTDTDSVLVSIKDNAGLQYGTNVSHMGVKFTSTIDIDVTQLAFSVCDNGSNVGDVKAGIWTHNEVSDEPDEEVSGLVVTVAASALSDCDTQTEVSGVVVPVYETLSAGTYWFIVYEDGATVNWLYDATHSPYRLCYGSGGSSWSCIANHSIPADVYGCEHE